MSREPKTDDLERQQCEPKQSSENSERQHEPDDSQRNRDGEPDDDLDQRP